MRTKRVRASMQNAEVIPLSQNTPKEEKEEVEKKTIEEREAKRKLSKVETDQTCAKTTPDATPVEYKLLQRGSEPRLIFSRSIWEEPNRKSMTVSICIPEPDEECPLTLHKISDSRIEFLPDTTFFEDRPLHTKIKLPCGHGFHALSLIYSWCKTKMLCPCCRAGVDVQAGTDCLPSHFKDEIEKRVVAITQEEIDLEEEESTIQTISLISTSISFESQALMGRLFMVVSFYRIETDANNAQHEVVRTNTARFLLFPGVVNRNLFRVSDTQRMLFNHLGARASSFRVCLITELPGVGPITMERTELIHLPKHNDDFPYNHSVQISPYICTTVGFRVEFDRIVTEQYRTSDSKLTVTFQNRSYNSDSESEHRGIYNITWEPANPRVSVLLM